MNLTAFLMIPMMFYFFLAIYLVGSALLDIFPRAERQRVLGEAANIIKKFFVAIYNAVPAEAPKTWDETAGDR